MATYNERITAGTLTRYDRNGVPSVASASAEISMQVNAVYPNLGSGYDEWLTWEPDYSASTYASSKKRQQNPIHSLYITSRSVTGSGSLPSGSAFEAAWRRAHGAFGAYALTGGIIAPYYSAVSALAQSAYLQLSTPLIAFEAIGASGAMRSGTQYAVTSKIKVDGPSGSHPPYTDVVWEDLVPVVSGMTPSGGAFVDETKSKTFTWTVGNVTAFDGSSVLGTSVFKWRANGVTHTVNANPTSVTIPANTFPNGDVEWCVVHTTTDGQSNAESWQTVTTIEETPEAPSNLSPKNEVVNGNASTTFSWHHNVPTGSPQSKADLDYSADGTAWTTLATVTGANESVDIASGTLPGGEVQWRVRTYNTDNVAGPYAYASIIVKARPLAPSIDSITGVPLASVSWSAADQVGFRVVFTDSAGNTYDSGERYGNVSRFTSPGLLAEGSATAVVSVGNSSGLWNSTSIQFTVTNGAEGTVTLNGVAEGGKAVLSWENDSDATAFYVLKNGKPIAKVYDTRYEDKTANGTAVYEVLAMNADSTYARSNAVTITVKLLGVQVFDYESNGELIDMFVRRDSIFELSKSYTANTSYYHFSGNTFPTAYSELHHNETISFTITKENMNLEAILGLLGTLCCIKDKTGAVAFGILDSVGAQTDRYTDLTLSFTRTADEEGVAYEA